MKKTKWYHVIITEDSANIELSHDGGKTWDLETSYPLNYMINKSGRLTPYVDISILMSIETLQKYMGYKHHW